MYGRFEEGDPQRAAFRSDVLAGLARAPKALPSRWLYDTRGSELFEEITHLDEYYPTRTETEILRRHAAEIAEFCGHDGVLLEYGAGAGIKTEILINALQSPRLYVPVDIAGHFLDQTVARFRRTIPKLTTRPFVADFTSEFDLPDWVPQDGRIAFFPGSTMGNLSAEEAGRFLRQMRAHVGVAGRAVIGLDMKKNLDVLLRAYDDRAGVTAQFNLNLLARVNRELGGDFVLERFKHGARWREVEQAVEMHLISTVDQDVHVGGIRFHFDADESIHTESSRKYDLSDFSQMARKHGWSVERVWTDERNYFSVVGLRPSSPTKDRVFSHAAV